MEKKQQDLGNFTWLDGAMQQQLLARRLWLLQNKTFTPVQGLELSADDIEWLALQLALPLLALPDRYADGWHEVVIYPSSFVVNEAWQDEDGLVHEGEIELDGLCMERGPLLLSWQALRSDARSGIGNVAIHEVAHKLDLLDGVTNGCPPLPPEIPREQWASAWQAAYEQCLDREIRGDYCAWLDEQALDHPSEFFAVVSEVFFTQPAVLRAECRGVYDLLTGFYRQNPLAKG